MDASVVLLLVCRMKAVFSHDQWCAENDSVGVRDMGYERGMEKGMQKDMEYISRHFSYSQRYNQKWTLTMSHRDVVVSKCTSCVKYTISQDIKTTDGRS